MEALPPHVAAFVVCEYSTQNALTKRHPEIIDTLLETAKHTPNVGGIVAQSITREQAGDLFVATPGVHLSSEKDDKDQSYRKPSEIGSDLFIVGRGIYKAADPVEAAKQYREAINA